MRVFHCLLIALFAFAASPAAAEENATQENPAQQAFRALSALVGDWEGSTTRGPHRVSYRLTANGTVLVETWTMSPTRQSMTLYAVDGERLLATHYCPQGNQPRLQLSGRDANGRYRFRFLDGTNLQDPSGAHQHAFWVEISAADSFTRSETYVENGENDITGEDGDEPVSYHRLPPPEA